MAQPVSIENFVKPLPIRMGRAKQRPERRLEEGWAGRRRVGENRERVPRFRKTDLEAVVTQRAREAREATTHSVGHALAWLTGRGDALRHSCSHHLAEETRIYLAREPCAI